MAANHSRFEYEVRGHGLFPFDMLRYDAAHPQREADSARIESTTRRGEGTDPVTVALVSEHHPTDARWRSHGWRVISLREIRNAGTAKERTVVHESPMTLGM